MGLTVSGQGWFGPNNNKQIRTGNLDYKKGQYDEAVEKYGKVYQNKPNDPIANFNMANALYKSGKMDSAMVHFNNAIHSTNDDMIRSKAYYNLGNAYLSKNDLQNAIGSYKESLKLDPSDENTRYNLSYALSKVPVEEKKKNSDMKPGEEGGDQDGLKKDPNGDQKIQDKQNDGKNPQKNEDQQPSGQQPKMNKDMAQQLLNALNNRERDALKKMNDAQGEGTNKPEKDW